LDKANVQETAAADFHGGHWPMDAGVIFRPTVTRQVEHMQFQDSIQQQNPWASPLTAVNLLQDYHPLTFELFSWHARSEHET